MKGGYKMATNAVWLKVDGEGVVPAFEKALTKLDSAGGEIRLDFSSVHRIDASALKTMEDFAIAAHDKATKVVLRGVNIDVYRVFKLMKLESRFSFVS